jgi:hypothetical protein
MKRPLFKVAAVLGGYVVAIVAGCGAQYVGILGAQGPDVEASAGMYAVGDAIVFVAVFGVVSLLPTALALYFLRPFGAFWSALSIASVALAVTGVGAMLLMRSASSEALDHPLGGASVLAAFLLIAVAPLLAGGFFISALVAPTRSARWTLVAAAIVEAVVGASSLGWFLSYRLL